MGFAKYTTKLGSGLTGPSFFCPRGGYLGLLRMRSSSAGHAGRSVSPTNLKAVTTIKRLGQKDKAPDLLSQACHALFRHELRQNMVPFLKANGIAPKKVFVSYSWANPAYNDVTPFDSQLLEQNAVQQCAEDLLYANIRVWIDVNKARLGDALANDGFDSKSEDNIIETNIKASDTVLIMGTPVYLAKYLVSDNPDCNRTHMVYDEVRYIHTVRNENSITPNVRNKKNIIPAFLGASARECIPRSLLEGRRVELDFGDSEDYFKQAFRLIRDIYGIPHHQEDYKKIVDDFFVSMNGLLAFEAGSVGLVKKLRYYQSSIGSVEEVTNMLAYNEGSQSYKSSNANVVLFNSPYVSLYFIRRAKLSDKLDEVVEQYPSSYDGQPKVLAVFGLGGSGKSQFAADFFLRNAKAYDFALWIESESYRSVVSAYRQFLQKHLDVAAREKLTKSLLALSDKEVVELFQDFFTTSGNALIVYDNAGSYEEFEGMLPQWGKHLIMATTRLNDWPECGHIEVKGMESDESVKLMRNVTKIDDQTDGLYELSEVLGHLPLAIAQASAYIDNKKMTVSDYLDLYRKSRVALLSSSTMPKGLANKHEPVWVTWDINMRQVQSLMPAAEDLLKFMCFLSSNNIQRELLEESGHKLKDFKSSILNLVVWKTAMQPFWFSLIVLSVYCHINTQSSFCFLFAGMSVLPINDWMHNYLVLGFLLQFNFPGFLVDDDLVSALQLLVKYSLVSSDERYKVFSVHSLMQDTVRSKLSQRPRFRFGITKEPIFFYLAALYGSSTYLRALENSDDELASLFFLDHVEALLFSIDNVALFNSSAVGVTFIFHINIFEQVNDSLAFFVDEYFRVCRSFGLHDRIKRLVYDFSLFEESCEGRSVLNASVFLKIIKLNQISFCIDREDPDYDYRHAKVELDKTVMEINGRLLMRWENKILQERVTELYDKIQQDNPSRSFRP